MLEMVQPKNTVFMHYLNSNSTIYDTSVVQFLFLIEIQIHVLACLLFNLKLTVY